MLISPSITPKVLLYSSPIVIVTLPVAVEITVMFTAATSPTVMLFTVTLTDESTLDTLNEVVS